MDDDDDLFRWGERHTARRTDPPTSKRAISDEEACWAERQVLYVIAGRPQGACWREQTDALEPQGFQRQTISPRWKPLRKRGLIEARYETIDVMVDGRPAVTHRLVKRTGWSGRQQIVWFATEAGLAYARIARANEPPSLMAAVAVVLAELTGEGEKS